MSVIPRTQVRKAAWRAGLAGSRAAGRLTSGDRPLPDFLVVGAQRCGTTSLHRYLIAHPAVLGANRTKGVHWFDTAFDRPEAWYRAHFPSAARRATVARTTGVEPVVGEASPYYLFHPAVPCRVAEVVPDIRLIALLRDPVERAWSHWHHETARGFEDLPFEAALDAETDRLAGEAELLVYPAYRSESHQHHSYASRGHYAEQLNRLWARVPREQVLVLFTEELGTDPERALDEAFRFLGVPPLVRSTGGTGPRRWNERSKGQLPAAAHARLEADLAPDAARLETLLGRPLPWSWHR